MFIAVLFAIAKSQKQSKCPPKDEWINYGLFIRKILLLKKKKRKELLIHSKTLQILK